MEGNFMAEGAVILENALTQVKKLYVFVKQNVIWSLPIKFLLGAVLGALGGSSLLGILSEYATYFYAMSYGIRPPTEGVPYLKASVTLISLMLLISGALIYCMTTVLFKSFAKLTTLSGLTKNLLLQKRLEKNFDRPVSDLRVLFADKSLLPVLGTAVLAAAMAYGLVKLLVFLGPVFIPPEIIQPAAIGYAIFAFFAFLTLIRPGTIVWVSLMTTAVYFMVWFVFLFTPAYYSNLLRFVGYGGGLPITVEMKEKAQLPLDSTLYLIIRTTDAFIVLNESTHQFVEIPKEEVRTVRHNSGGLNNLLFYLPDIQQQIFDRKS
jgi:hypothetical protein